MMPRTGIPSIQESSLGNLGRAAGFGLPHASFLADLTLRRLVAPAAGIPFAGGFAMSRDDKKDGLRLSPMFCYNPENPAQTILFRVR